MKNWKMALKMTFGFGIIILLLLITVFWAISGITTIVGDAEIIIAGNKLDSQLAQREVEHLNWAGNINSLLTDSEVTVLNVQLDDHECAFGKWLFGEERKEAEALVPSLAPLFNEIEESHRRLHQSAAKIKGSFVQADATIPSLLKQREIEHLQWAARIRDALLAGERSLSVETDPSRCNLGIWFSSETARDMYRNGSVEFNAVWDEMLIQHENLHQSAAILSEIMAEDPVAALDYFNTTTLSYLDNTLAYLNRLTESAENDVEKMKHANEIYTRETQPALKDVQETLHAIREEARLNIMTDEQMLKDAVDTRMAVILIGAIALLAGIVFAIIITRGITVPLRKGILLAGNLSEGDLTADIDLQQRDELGQLAESLVTMKESLKRVVTDVLLGSDNVLSGSRQLSATAQQLAQGAAEQAASTEEVSSSMEEMDSSINLNADNAAQAEVIARDAVSIVGDGSESVNETVAAMKQIAEKISIIEEIARQTNMLSLNAAIEAARAGEHGKGFAVVAAEVGKLSSQSKIAANEISEIADSSVSLADKTGELIGSIVPKISQTADFIQEINAASNEQKTGAYQITQAITQLDQVVQQNASASEESAAMAEELSSQAEKLKQLVSFFKIDSDINILKKRRINETDADISAQSEFLNSKPKKQFLPEPEASSEEITGVGLRGEGASKSSFDNDFEEF